MSNSFRRSLMVLIGLGALLFFAYIINKYSPVPEAAEEKVNITVTVKKTTLTLGEESEATFIMKPEKQGNKISGVNLKFDSQNATLTNIEDCKDTITNSSDVFTQLISKIDQNGGQKSCVVLKKDSELPEIAQLTVKYKCNAQGTGIVSIDQSKSQIVGPVSDSAYIFGTVDQAKFECSGQAPAEDASITFDPTSCTAEVGGDCIYALNVQTNSSDKKLSGYHLKLKYDPSIIQAKNVSTSQPTGVLGEYLAQAHTTPNPGSTVASPTPGTHTVPSPTNVAGASCTTDADCRVICPAIDCPQLSCINGQCIMVPTGGVLSPIPSISVPVPSPPSDGCEEVLNRIDETNGEIHLAFVCNKKASSLPTKLTAQLTFTGKSNGEGKVTVLGAEVMGPTDGYLYSLSKGEATYKIGQGGQGEGNVKLNLKLRLQGITKKPKARDTVKVRIGAEGGTMSEPHFQTVDFKSNENGYFEGSASFNLAKAANYIIYVKTAIGLQKKICDANPSEQYPGSYHCDKGKISLNTGEHSLDFSKVILVAGDFEPQNGIANAYEASMLRNALGQCGTDTVKIADVNFDGCINAIDHSLFIAALSIRYDDGYTTAY